MSLRLPEGMRGELKEPMGDVSTDVEKGRLGEGRVFAVGDMVTYHLLEAGVTPDVAVVDGRTEREEVDDEVIECRGEMRVEARVENAAGTVSRGLVEALREAYDEGGLVEVEGEEDLAVLPVVALADGGDVVLYGQPDEGMVYVDVDDEVRRYVLDVMDRMEGDGVVPGLRNS